MKKNPFTTLILLLIQLKTISSPFNTNYTIKFVSKEIFVPANQVVKNKDGGKVKNKKTIKKNKAKINNKGKKIISVPKKKEDIPNKRQSFNTDSPTDKLIEKEKETY